MFPVQHKAHIVPRAQRRDEPVLLKDKGKPPVFQAGDAAAVRLQKPAQQVKQGGLAGAGGSKKQMTPLSGSSREKFSKIGSSP